MKRFFFRQLFFLFFLLILIFNGFNSSTGWGQEIEDFETQIIQTERDLEGNVLNNLSWTQCISIGEASSHLICNQQKEEEDLTSTNSYDMLESLQENIQAVEKEIQSRKDYLEQLKLSLKQAEEQLTSRVNEAKRLHIEVKKLEEQVNGFSTRAEHYTIRFNIGIPFD